MNTIGIINLGNSNLMSLTNTLDYLNIDYKIVNNNNELESINKIILPGVGSFGDGINRLCEANLFEKIIDEVINKKKPILGICLGMQLLFESSSESIGRKGLGILKGQVVGLIESAHYKIPRIGWASGRICFDFLGLHKNEDLDFYFIHSYHAKVNNELIVSIKTEENITAAIQMDNVYGCQFHPEKSHINGLRILKSFSEEG
jgi:imidazole glycerol-phosphate synthase subunit HisH